MDSAILQAVAALSRNRLQPLLAPAAAPAGAPARPPVASGRPVPGGRAEHLWRRARPDRRFRTHHDGSPPAFRAGFPFRLLLLLGCLPLLLLTSVVFVYREQQTDKVYAGVTALGVGLGRMTQDEAAQTIKRHLSAESRRPLQLRYDDDAFTTSLATMGLRVEDGQAERWAQEAWEVGRDTDLRTWLRSQLILMRRGHELPMSFTFDRERAVAALARAALEVERQPVNAGLSVEKAGEQFEIHTSPARTGRRLNVPATLERLQSSLHSQLPTHLDLVLDEALPAVGDADVVPAVESLRHLLGPPLELKDGTRSWALTPAQAHPMLEISGLEAAKPPIVATLNEARLRAFVEGVTRQATVVPVNPFFEVQNDRVVVRPGSAGKAADLEATFNLVKERVASPNRTVEIVFAEDKPWITEADLTPARDQVNALLDLPITLEAPPAPGTPATATPTPAAAGAAAAARGWRLDRPLLAQMLALPNTQAVPRDFRTLPPAQRPTFEIQLDSGKVTNYLAREVAPWVSEDPLDAQLQQGTAQVEVTRPGVGDNAAPVTVRENRPLVELRNARDGRGPDYLGTFGAMQAFFRPGTATNPEERKVTVRIAPRPARVQDRDLAPARDQANRMIGEPVMMRWGALNWTVTRDELASMLRYQGSAGSTSAYLTRDALLTRATAIARDLERHPEAPKGADGAPRKVDVPATASALWIQASTVERNRSAQVVLEPEPEPEPAPSA